MAEETMNDWASTFVRIVSFIGLILNLIAISLCITILADKTTSIVKSRFLAAAPIWGIFFLLIAFGGYVYSIMQSRTGNLWMCLGIYVGWIVFFMVELIIGAVFMDTFTGSSYAVITAMWGWKLSNILDV